MLSQTLTDIGLSPVESKVYLSLISVGPSPATKISKDIGVHRSNVYSSLNRLSSRGLVSSSKLDRHVLFSANNPNLLLSLVKEKENSLMSILPSLVLSSSFSSPLDISVVCGLPACIDAIFSLKVLSGDLFFVGDLSSLPVSLSSKLSLFFREEIIISKFISSQVLIFVRENTSLVIFPSSMKTLKVISSDLSLMFISLLN